MNEWREVCERFESKVNGGAAMSDGRRVDHTSALQSRANAILLTRWASLHEVFHNKTGAYPYQPFSQAPTLPDSHTPSLNLNHGVRVPAT